MKKALVCSLLALVFAGGCRNYSWRSWIPEDMRSVSVPVFVNETNVTELGPIAARQVLREFQREGTFKVKRDGEAALEIQGVIKKVGGSAVSYNRRSGLRHSSYDFTADVEVSIIDKRKGRVVIDNRKYVARTTFAVNQDIITARRDAANRLAEDLARQVVDDALSLEWEEGEKQ